MHDANNAGTTTRILAKLLRDCLHDCRYADLSDLVADLKARAGRARIRWTPGELTDALALVGSNRALIVETLPRLTAPPRELPAVPPVPSEIASRILQELRRRTGMPIGPQAIAPVRRVSQRRADTLRALAQVTRLIADVGAEDE